MGQVTVHMSASTVQALRDRHSNLLVFKGASASDRFGMVPVWFSAYNLQPEMTIAWDPVSLWAYSSQSELGSGVPVTPTMTGVVALGQTATLQPNGFFSISSGGPANAVTIANQSGMGCVGGLMQQVNGMDIPISAFALGTVVVAPIELVLLAFCSSWSSEWEVLLSSIPAPGLLADLANNPSVNVSFDINEGWSWGSAPWGKAVAADASLAELLILPRS